MGLLYAHDFFSLLLLGGKLLIVCCGYRCCNYLLILVALEIRVLVDNIIDSLLQRYIIADLCLGESQHIVDTIGGYTNRKRVYFALKDSDFLFAVVLIGLGLFG